MKKIVNGCSGVAVIIMHEHVYIKITKLNNFTGFRSDIERLGIAFNLPKTYVCKYGTKASGMEALLIMLRRLTYPNRWCDLVPIFGRAEPELSVIFNKVT